MAVNVWELLKLAKAWPHIWTTKNVILAIFHMTLWCILNTRSDIIFKNGENGIKEILET